MIGNQSRRAFLQRTAAIGVAGSVGTFVSQLAGIGEAAASTASDYKALVCVFLNGGNDYANTLPPYDQASYDLYFAARPSLAHSRASLSGTQLAPNVSLPGGRQYALAPTMAPLMPVFDAGDLAVILNVGTLVRPTTKSQFNSGTVALPPNLFSHNDQQSYWQASGPEGAVSGWGGRLGDLLQSGNGASALTCVNAGGNAVFLSGRTAIQYVVGTAGPTALVPRTALYWSPAGATALKAIMSTPDTHMLGAEYAAISKRALDLYDQVDTALGTAPAANFPLFPSGNSLADQLKIVARMIATSSALGMKRQVFFVQMGGFDTHDGLATNHPGLVGRVATAMRAFYDTTVALGFADKVTTFTASDFGRTLTPNNDGSDHGWGSMHFVMGGAVNGKQLYGTPPAIGSNTQDDVGQGKLLPTISVDQYSATMANWFGVSAGNMSTVLPNIGNYNPSSWNLGFV